MSATEDISAGYLLILPNQGWEHQVAGLPSRVISVSRCVCSRVSLEMAASWVEESEAERVRLARRLGIRDEAFTTASDWLCRAFNEERFGFIDVFFSLDDARRFRDEMIAEESDLQIIGLSLDEAHVASVVNELVPAPGQGELGIYQALRRGQPPEPDGRILGYEITGMDVGASFHSFRCNGLERDFVEKLGTSFNAQGLVDAYAAALECAEHSALDATGSEPGLWLPWRLTAYSSRA